MILPLKFNQALQEMQNQGLEIVHLHLEEALAILERLNQTAETAQDAIQEFLELIEAEPKYFHIGRQVVYEFLDPESIVYPLEDVLETLQELGQIHQLALVSRGSVEQQYLKLKLAGIDTSFFNKIIISEADNKKLHYKQVAEELGYFPGQVIVCGDRIEYDLKPAKELNYTTVQMLWGRGLQPQSKKKLKYVDFRIKKFQELKKIILKLSNLPFLKEDC